MRGSPLRPLCAALTPIPPPSPASCCRIGYNYNHRARSRLRTCTGPTQGRGGRAPEAARASLTRGRLPTHAVHTERQASPPMKRRTRQPTIRPTVAPAAELAAAMRRGLEAVLHDHRRLAPAMADALKRRSGSATSRTGRASRSLRALLRWWGWIETLHLRRPEEQLLLASLLDLPEVSAFAPGLGRADRPAGRPPGAGRRRTELDGPRRGAEAMAGRPGGQRGSLAALPGLDPGPAPRAARRRHAQEATARIPRARSSRAAPPGSPCAAGMPRRSGPSSGRPSSSPGFTAGSPRRPSCRPRPTCPASGRSRPARLVVQDLASQAVGIRLRPRSRRTLVGRPRRGDGGLHRLPTGRAHGRKGRRRLHVRTERRRHEAALRLRRRGVSQHHHEGAGQASTPSARPPASTAWSSMPLVGRRDLAPPSRRPLGRRGRADPQLAAEQVRHAGHREHARSSRAGRSSTPSRPSPGPRPTSVVEAFLRVSSRIPVAALPPSAGRYDDRRHGPHLAPSARLRWAVHRADDPNWFIPRNSGRDGWG